MIRRLAALAVATLAACASAAAADGGPAPELCVRLRPAAAVADGYVRLDAVAVLSGPRAAEAAGVLLGRAPQAGQSRTLTSRAVGLRLEEEGFDARRFDVCGAEELVIRPAPLPAAASAPAPAAPGGDEFHALAAGALRAALAGRWGCPAEDVDVRVETARASGAPGDLRDVKAEAQLPAGNIRPGRGSAVVQLAADGKPAGRLQVSFEAALFREVPVASRDLPAGRTLAAEDICLARVRLADPAAEVLTDAARAGGLVAARPIRAGAPLDFRSLSRPACVRRGQPVTMLCESGSVKITETVVACSDGALGDAVQIERPGPRRQVLTGIVAGPALVKVE